MIRIFVITLFVVLASPATALQQIVIPPEGQDGVDLLPNAIVCRDASAARIVATVLPRETFISAQELIERYRVVGRCAPTRLPDDFDSPKAIADEDANISAGQKASDGRQTLIYELSKRHARNREDFVLFLILLP